MSQPTQAIKNTEASRSVSTGNLQEMFLEQLQADPAKAAFSPRAVAAWDEFAASPDGDHRFMARLQSVASKDKAEPTLARLRKTSPQTAARLA